MTEPRTPKDPGPSPRHHRYRLPVLGALDALGEPASPAAIHSHLHARGLRIGLSTVYRELRSLLARGEVDELQLWGQRCYRASSARPSNVFVCDECGHSETAPPDRRWAVLVEGRLDPTRPLVIHGRCTSCRRERPT